MSTARTQQHVVVGLLSAVALVAVLGAFGPSVAGALGFVGAQDDPVDPTTTVAVTEPPAPTTAAPTTVAPTEPPVTEAPATTEAPVPTAAPAPSPAPAPAPAPRPVATQAPRQADPTPTTAAVEPGVDDESDADADDDAVADARLPTGTTIEPTGDLVVPGTMTTETVEAVSDAGGGLSEEAKVRLVVMALLAMAAIAAVLTALYWRHTRPGVFVDDDEPDAGADDLPTGQTAQVDAGDGEHAAKDEPADGAPPSAASPASRGAAAGSPDLADGSRPADRAPDLSNTRLGASTTALPIITLDDLERGARSGGHNGTSAGYGDGDG